MRKGSLLARPSTSAPFAEQWGIPRVEIAFLFGAQPGCPAIDFSACVAPLPLHFGAALQSQARVLVATMTLGSGDPALQVHADSNKAGVLQPLDWRANIAANIRLEYDTCSCGRLTAICTVPVAEGAQLVAGLNPSDTTTYLLQFDGSHNRPHGVGGAGTILFRLLSGRCSTCFWSAIPIQPCSDNLEAEAVGLVAGLRSAVQWVDTHEAVPENCLIVCQGDILPHLKHMQYEGRIKRFDLAHMLAEARGWIARAHPRVRYVHLPREANTVADYLAGFASAEAVGASRQGSVAPPSQPRIPPTILGKWSFDSRRGEVDSGADVPVFIEQPWIDVALLQRVAAANPSWTPPLQAYLAMVQAEQGRVQVGYTTRAPDGLGRFYAVGPAAQAGAVCATEWRDLHKSRGSRASSCPFGGCLEGETVFFFAN